MPIAHLLAPQILRRAQEIDDALYPRPAAAGYLRASAPAPRQYHPVEISTPALVRGEQPVRHEKAPASEKGLAELRGRNDRPDTVFKNAARAAVPRQASKGKIRPIPNAPAPKGGAVGTDEVVGVDENSRPIYASVPGASPVKKKKGGRTTIALPAGAVGVNERGAPI